MEESRNLGHGNQWLLSHKGEAGGEPVPEDSRHNANYEMLLTIIGGTEVKTDNEGVLRLNSSLQEQRKIYYITKRWRDR